MRLVTRIDLDSLACALILREHEPIREIVLVDPQQITDKTVDIEPDDILANLPYHPHCGMWFDHHLLTPSNETPPEDFRGRYRVAESAAQLVWEHYGKEDRWAELVAETNKLDAAQLSEDDVLRPQAHILLGFTLDPATGLGNDEAYFRKCLEWLRSKSLNQVLIQPEVRDRIIRMFEQNEDFCWTLARCSRLSGNVVFTDFRQIKEPPAGNRFLIYTLFPEANVSVLARWGYDPSTVMLKVGHSIFNRTCTVSVGDLMSEYGGGGHAGAGSTPVPIMEADQKIVEIVDRLQQA